jgi:hypothetical protein
MTKQELIEQMKLSFRNEFNFLTSEEIDNLYEIALGIYLELSYPVHISISELPDSDVRRIWWIKAVMKEILERNGCTSLVAYTENGLSYRFDSSLISEKLIGLITPLAKIVRRE